MAPAATKNEPSPTKSDKSESKGASAKKQCTAFERFVKKQDGDVSLLREP